MYCFAIGFKKKHGIVCSSELIIDSLYFKKEFMNYVCFCICYLSFQVFHAPRARCPPVKATSCGNRHPYPVPPSPGSPTAICPPTSPVHWGNSNSASNDPILHRLMTQKWPGWRHPPPHTPKQPRHRVELTRPVDRYTNVNRPPPQHHRPPPVAIHCSWPTLATSGASSPDPRMTAIFPPRPRMICSFDWRLRRCIFFFHFLVNCGPSGVKNFQSIDQTM